MTEIHIILVGGKVISVHASQKGAEAAAKELRSKRKELTLQPRMLEIIKQGVKP